MEKRWGREEVYSKPKSPDIPSVLNQKRGIL